MEDVNKRRQTFLSLSKLECAQRNKLQGNWPTLAIFRELNWNATKLEKTPIHFKSDVFAAVTFVDAKKSLVSTVVSALC